MLSVNLVILVIWSLIDRVFRCQVASAVSDLASIISNSASPAVLPHPTRCFPLRNSITSTYPVQQILELVQFIWVLIPRTLNTPLIPQVLVFAKNKGTMLPSSQLQL